MLSYIKLKNFKSFKDTVFDFRNGSKGFKRFISIYGENGSGKSNFVSAIDFLAKSIDSFILSANTEKLAEMYQEKDLPSEIMDMVINIFDFDKLRNDCLMIECDEDTTIEYGFEKDGHEGYYIISFKSGFSYEKLYYYTGKQRGVLFEIKNEKDSLNVSFSSKLFKNKKAEAEIREEISKYWGKHSLLSIFNKELREKNPNYVRESFLEYVFDFIHQIDDLTISKAPGSPYGIDQESQKSVNILKSLKDGKVKKDKIDILNRTETILRDFFTQAYADIKDVFYDRKENSDVITYKLYVKKMIGGKIRTLEFSKESAGTKHILDIIRSLLGAFCGSTVIFDEIDNGIHDLLLKNIIESMIDSITGQLIITTHNTYLLETVDIKAIYVINVDYLGNKEVVCLDRFPRIQGNNNPRLMYLRGLFGGVPMSENLDYDAIISELAINADNGESED